MASYQDIGVSIDGRVGIVEIRKPPNNFFDVALINQIADALEAFDANDDVRSVLFCAEGRAFCAGADFSSRPDTGLVTESGFRVRR